MVQKIIRLESEFMIIRGRLAGTHEAGRVQMIPYSQLAFVAVVRDLKDTEVEAIFGKGAPPAFADLPADGSGDELTLTPETPAEVVPVTDRPAAVPPKKKADAVSKTVLLAKLRERFKEAGPAGK